MMGCLNVGNPIGLPQYWLFLRVALGLAFPSGCLSIGFPMIRITLEWAFPHCIQALHTSSNQYHSKLSDGKSMRIHCLKGDLSKHLVNPSAR